MTQILGIDVGATGIKGAIVDTEKGELCSKRLKIQTPSLGKPDDITEVINEIIQQMDWNGKPIGIGFPAAIQGQICMTASNIDDSWIGVNMVEYLTSKTGSDLVVLNDADAAGIAEMKFGKGKKLTGTVLLITLGTGIGSALFINGTLVPNTELGHLLFMGDIAEKYVSNSARKIHELDWKTYGERLGKYLAFLHRLFYPSQIILGGGISKKFDNYSGEFPSGLNVVPASNLNNAGIIGAALAYNNTGQ